VATEPEIAPAFEVIPAIDLAEGRVVRLVQGRFEAVSDFGGDPLATADRFWSAGARTLHVVDLDAARTGRRSALHRDLIARLAERRPPGGRLQVGGGFRDGGAIAEAAALGVDRVVVGTLAFREPAAFDELLREHAPRLCVSADTLAGSVRVAGWAEDSGVDVGDALRDLSARGALAFLVTAIDRDGTLAGPDVPLMTRLRSATPGLLLASGGIGRLEDLRAVRASGADGVVVGRALLAGAFSLDEALDAVAT
jgi:phosphoribosylformimino-5-aminoimidazole carboxamide ribotide isomerase